jgi:magnesium transporter
MSEYAMDRPSDARRGRTSSRHERAGTSPGTLRAVPNSSPPHGLVMSYDAEDFDEQTLERLRDAGAWRGRRAVTWVDVHGLGDADAIKQLGAEFGLHELALEDVLAVHHRAKFERYDDHVFFVLRIPEYSEEHGLETDQLSIFLGKEYVLSFQGSPGDCFGAVRERIRGRKGRIRSRNSHYLVYALLDAVIDSYYPVVERIGDRLDELEDDVLEHGHQLTENIHDVRRDLLVLRRAIWPMREILNELLRDEDADPVLQPFFRDCYDHVVELIDLIETYRDLSAGLMEVYVSIVGNRMNEIMKVLTIIATIFIPLSFVASVYGMNFDTSVSPLNMPELHWEYGYLASLAVMAAIAFTMLFWFWRRGWLRGHGGERE